MSRRKALSLGRPPGRPSELDEDTMKRITDALRLGANLRDAAQRGGVHVATVCRWAVRGAEEQARIDAGLTAPDRADQGLPDASREAPYREFHEQLTQARTDFKLAKLAVVNRVAAGGYVLSETVRRYADPDTGEMVEEKTVKRAAPNWQAAWKLLERRFPAEFGMHAPALEDGLSAAAADEDSDVSTSAVAQLAERFAAHIAEQRQLEAGGEVDPGEPIEDAEIVPDEPGL